MNLVSLLVIRSLSSAKSIFGVYCIPRISTSPETESSNSYSNSKVKFRSRSPSSNSVPEYIKRTGISSNKEKSLTSTLAEVIANRKTNVFSPFFVVRLIPSLLAVVLNNSSVDLRNSLSTVLSTCSYAAGSG